MSNISNEDRVKYNIRNGNIEKPNKNIDSVTISSSGGIFDFEVEDINTIPISLNKFHDNNNLIKVYLIVNVASK
jgi:hypothetical protein